MNKKTVVILAVLGAGGCCFFGVGGVILMGAFAGEGDAEGTASATAVPAAGIAGGNPALGGYKAWGRATPTAEGFAEALNGKWMQIDGAPTVVTIEQISEDVVKVKGNRSGELWHFAFEDGSYVFHYVVTFNGLMVMNVERGEWSADAKQLTLTPSSCVEATSSEKKDCLDPGARSYQMTTVQLEELVPDGSPAALFTGLRLVGPTPKFASSPNPLSSMQLQRVR